MMYVWEDIMPVRTAVNVPCHQSDSDLFLYLTLATVLLDFGVRFHKYSIFKTHFTKAVSSKLNECRNYLSLTSRDVRRQPPINHTD